MPHLRTLPSLLAACLATTVHASDQIKPSVVLRASGAAESAGGDSSTWRERSVGVSIGLKPRQTLDLSAAEISRFGVDDTQFDASFSTPLADRLTATFNAGASSKHRLLARHILGGALQYAFAPEWVAHVGGKRSTYDTVTVDQGTLALERVFSSYSVLVGWHPTYAFGRSANSAEVRANWHYDERSVFTLQLADGREAASVPDGVTLADVRSATLGGRHWINRHWAISWSAGHTRQGLLHSRNGISLGFQYAF